ncbi:MAG: serine/threonine protein kinase [Labilithrix sp.]|nr:serine/threonine protein kinase [Labilithrix sp.]MCW5814046.1 serine/threonine protein kinase [Labilithrix sp.]
MPSVGDTLGRYELLARLKAGGMATLFVGKRVGAAGFARPVAIKVIHSHLADDPKLTRMFIDEAMLSAKIQDPHVVHVEEFGESDGTYYLVMELVAGVSLGELLRALRTKKRALSVDVAVWLAAQVAAGLHAAHESSTETGEPLGIVHRDVSPQNVLLAFKGHVKLIDFGIAKAQSKDTQSSVVRGKVAYMPPEQARGEEIDRRADVYALGVILWEMLTMRRLFDAENEFVLLDMVRNPKVVPPRELVPAIPPALDAIVMEALAPDPAARIATAETLRIRLLEAVPAASTKGSSQLAALLAATMPDAIQRSRDLLKDVLAAEGGSGERSVPPPAAAPAEALETLTVALDEVELEAQRRRSRESMPERAADAGTGAIPIELESQPSVERPARRGVGLVLGLGALVGMGLVAGVFAYRATTPPPAEAPPPPPPPPVTSVVEIESVDAGPAVAPPTPPPPPSAEPVASTRRSTRPRTGPRPAAPAASNVEMHESTPIFKRGP